MNVGIAPRLLAGGDALHESVWGRSPARRYEERTLRRGTTPRDNLKNSPLPFPFEIGRIKGRVLLKKGCKEASDFAVLGRSYESMVKKAERFLLKKLNMSEKEFMKFFSTLFIAGLFLGILAGLNAIH